jgi:hypothetical protein
MRYYCIPAAQGMDPPTANRRKNSYRVALNRGVEPGQLFHTREEAEARAAEVTAATRLQWIVKEVALDR